MFRRLLAVLLTLFAIATAGWFALKRGDIAYDTLERAYSFEASDYFTTRDGVKIHYLDEGSAEGPTLILVHGFSASVHTWRDWVNGLTVNYRVISIDLPGHGFSHVPQDAQIGIPYFVETVDQLASHLSLDGFTLIGSSMGGNTTWSYALSYPGKLDGIVLVAASGWPKSEEDADEAPFFSRIMRSDWGRMLLKDLDATYVVRSGLEDSFVDDTIVTDEMVSRYASFARAPGHRDALFTLVTRDDPAGIASAAKLAPLADMPVLILQGEEDALVPVGDARQFNAAIRDSEMIIYPNVGHLPHEEIAAQSLADVRNFLDRNVYAAPVVDEEDAVSAAE